MTPLQCPYCYSDNISNLSADSNEFICNDCSENFQADNNLKLEEEQSEENNNATFIDIDAATALKIANQLKKNNDNLNE